MVTISFAPSMKGHVLKNWPQCQIEICNRERNGQKIASLTWISVTAEPRLWQNNKRTKTCEKHKTTFCDSFLHLTHYLPPGPQQCDQIRSFCAFGYFLKDLFRFWYLGTNLNLITKVTKKCLYQQQIESFLATF